MARETQKRVIDGLTFTVQQLPGREAGRLFIRVSKYLLPGIARAGKALDGLSMGDGGLANATINMANASDGLANAAEFIFSHLDEKEYDALVDKLLDTCIINDGKTEQLLMNPGVFDNALAGKVLTQLKLLQFALETNYKDFWNGPGAKLRAAAQAAVSKFGESSTSPTNGPAGG